MKLLRFVSGVIAGFGIILFLPVIVVVIILIVALEKILDAWAKYSRNK